MATGASIQRASETEAQTATTDLAPSKRDLSSWWKQFKRNNKKEDEKGIYHHSMGCISQPFSPLL